MAQIFGRNIEWTVLKMKKLTWCLSFVFCLQVGQGYPHDPPKVKCETMVYHPNIDLEGNVCLNILRYKTCSDVLIYSPFIPIYYFPVCRVRGSFKNKHCRNINQLIKYFCFWTEYSAFWGNVYSLMDELHFLNKAWFTDRRKQGVGKPLPGDSVAPRVAFDRYLLKIGSFFIILRQIHKIYFKFYNLSQLIPSNK